MGNERADELARRGSQSTGLVIDGSIKPSICHLYRNFEAFFDERAYKLWHNEPRGNVSKSIWPTLSTKRTHSLLNLSKAEIRVMTGIITGHCNIRTFNSKWDLDATDYCRLCVDEEETETIEHLLCHCPALAYRRHRLMGAHFLPGLSFFTSTEPALIYSIIRNIKWLGAHNLGT